MASLRTGLRPPESNEKNLDFYLNLCYNSYTQSEIPGGKIIMAKPTLTTELNARISALEEELKAAKQKKKTTMSIKVSPKGGVSVYGLGRFPTTLYKGQWEKILDPTFLKELKEFIKENEGNLTVKS
jgi:hypothetical protein